MFLFLCIGALRYSVGRRGWRCICSQKAHENSITVSDYVSFSLIRICNIRLLYKLKMKIWWPIPSTPLTKDKNFLLFLIKSNFEVIMETSASLSDLRWLWLIVIQPRVFSNFPGFVTRYMYFLFEWFAGSRSNEDVFLIINIKAVWMKFSIFNEHHESIS